MSFDSRTHLANTEPGRYTDDCSQTVPGAPFSLDADQGQSFGRYTLVRELARGGMAQLYLARLTAAAGVSRSVVIKRIRHAYAQDPHFRRLFINEATIAAQLSHGNIAQVFDVGEKDREPFIVMEYVDGPPLSAVLRQAQLRGLGQLPEPAALLIAIELCKGLHHAHLRCDENGRPLRIVHRDVSPQNVLVSYEGQVKLVDFGIARACTEHQPACPTGEVMGKYPYFSPEQARGERVDAQTDVFAVGVLLYELLCGRLPWEGAFLEVARRADEQDFPKPRQVNPRVSWSVERVVLKALASRRAERFESAAALEEALNARLALFTPIPTPSLISSLMAYLYPSEVAARGVFRRSRSFESLTAAWNGTAGPPARSSSPAPLPSRPDDRPDDRADEVIAKPSRSALARWVLGVSLVVTVLLLGSGIFAASRYARFTVIVTTHRLGAEVRVDDEPWRAGTPVRIGNLSVFRRHRVEIRAPGHESWVGWVKPRWGGEVYVMAEPEPLSDREARR